MYYIYGRVRAIPTYRVYRLYDRDQIYRSYIYNKADSFNLSFNMTSSQKLLEAIENLEIAKNDPEFKCWAEQELQQDKHLRILTSGKTGSGKSTLLNGIVGSKFVVGHSLKPETKTVNAHEYSLGNLKVTAWDSPGLQDGTIDEQAYIKDIIEKTTAAGGIDLLLYCIRMDETRSDLHLHASAIQKLTKCNKNIWENAIVVLTFANQYEYQLSLSTEKDQIESSFNARVEDWRQTVCDELSRMGVSTDKIRCQPAGYHSLPHLPGRQYWASLLWAHAFAALKDRSKTVLLTLNADRMDFASETGQNDSQKTLEDQKIRVTSRFLEIIAKLNKAAVLLGCGAGGAVIGTAGTAVVGSTMGGTAAVAGGTAAVAGGTAAVAGGTVAVAGSTAAVAGGTAAVAGGTVAVAGSTAAVAGGTAAVAGGTAAVVGVLQQSRGVLQQSRVVLLQSRVVLLQSREVLQQWLGVLQQWQGVLQQSWEVLQQSRGVLQQRQGVQQRGVQQRWWGVQY